MQSGFLNNRVTAKTGDITKEETDAIVNAANSTLLGGGGVDGAIHSAGGKRILEECREIRRAQYPKGLPTGEAVITGGGNLPAGFVIHTVGPVFGIDKQNEAELPAKCYLNSLRLAAKNNLQTIAFPSISTGAFGYPKHEAAVISSQIVKKFLSDNEQIKEVRLVFFSETDLQKFIKHQLF